MNIPLKAYKDEKTSRLVFGMLDILETLGCTAGLTNRRLEKMAKACLAVGGITDSLADAKSANDGFFLGTREIIAFENSHYGERISFGSYDDIRRQDLSLVVDLGLVINSASLEKQATNNPKRGYALSPLFASLVKQFGKPGWEGALQMFRENSEFQNKIIETKNKLEEIREKVFVTAFLDKKKFQSMASDIAWESEVWIAEVPDHMIHFNGSRFLRTHL